MRKVAAEKGCKAVRDWYELERLESLFAGTESGDQPIDLALNEIEGAVDIETERWEPEHFPEDYPTEDAIVEFFEQMVSARLQSRFRIASFVAVNL